MNGDETPRLLLTVEEAAHLIGCGRSLMYELVLRHDIPSVKVGRLRRIPKTALDEYVARLMGAAA
jgi:excisionase family DNA binding protein